MTKGFTDWILYTSLFTALCAVSLCVATERLILQRLPALSALHVFIFGSTLVVYNAHFLMRRAQPERSDRFRWTIKNRHWHFIVFFLGLGLGGISLFFLPPTVIYICLLLGIFSFAYTFPLLPLTPAGRLRDHGWLKILTLTLVWTLTTAVLPMLYWDVAISVYPLELIIRFVFLFSLCVAFDVRDMQTDSRDNIQTIPNVIGTGRSYRLMRYSLVLFFLFTLFQYFRVGSEIRLLISAVVAVASWAAVFGSRKYRTDKYYLGVIDGLMLLYGGLIALFGHH